MSRNRVKTRARAIYAHLRANLNTPFTIDELLVEVGYQDGATTRSAIRRARDLAQADGLCLPVACPANDNTYCVTDHPGAVVDPAIHLGNIALGVGARKDVHDEFIRSRLAQLSPTERAMITSLDKFDAAAREQREAHHEVMKAMVAMRREQRVENNGSASA